MSIRSAVGRPSGTRKRAPKACTRCRDQKIRCSGSHPCQQCGKRGLNCHFDDQSHKVVVTRRYISNLQERLASLEYKASQSVSPEQLRSPDMSRSMGSSTDNARTPSRFENTPGALSGRPAEGVLRNDAENKAPLTNPLAFHIYDWVPAPKGKLVFMGTSSNWSFGRRVLTMTHERITGTPLPLDNLHFDGIVGKVFDLKWDGIRRPHETADSSTLPTQDFAVYLINSVKFHCGRLFNLFEEDPFMENFRLFHERPLEHPRLAPLWYVHYLLVLAFGKAFVVQSTKSRRPPGGELFVQAMKLMPDFTFFEADSVEQVQVLCCAALYLQCIDYRVEAWRFIGQALRIALEHGMHTEMQSQYLDDAHVQRSCTVWWTVYTLERMMASLMGVPMGISEDAISTPFPAFPGQPQRLAALQIQVNICRVLAKIDQTVYGLEGKLDSRYLGATQAVLRSIAHVTEQLNNSFEIHANEGMTGISRMSAHLHLLQHQCIILTTRPLLYTFLLSRLGQLEVALMHWLQSESVKGLIQMCTESAQQILRILVSLSDQGLLETFLPFDLDAAFTSTIVLLMAAGIDSSLLQDHSPWSQRAYAIMDEMSSRGNLVAEMVAAELRQLEGLLNKVRVKDSEPVSLVSIHVRSTPGESHAEDMDAAANTINVAGYSQGFEIDEQDEFGLGLSYELSAEQLMNIANSLEIDSLTWPLPGDGLGDGEGVE